MSERFPDPATPVTRRLVLKGGVATVLTAVLPISLRTVHASPTPVPGYLEAGELKTLSAVVDRMIPADHEAGALAANCARFIDAFLGAFRTDPPFIYAGAPFSDRAGHPQNLFREFLPLDEYETLGWRMVLEGSKSLPEREFNGPVIGLQQIYRKGLARLDERAGEFGVDGFSDLPPPAQDLLLNNARDAQIAALVDAAYLDTMSGMYGPPEYGGNADLAGWTYTGYDGDVQPRGYTEEQVIHADHPGPFDAMLPPSFSDVSAGGTPTRRAHAGPISHAEAVARAEQAPGTSVPLAAAPSPEIMSAALAGSEGRLSRLRAALAPYARPLLDLPGEGV